METREVLVQSPKSKKRDSAEAGLGRAGEEEAPTTSTTAEVSTHPTTQSAAVSSAASGAERAGGEAGTGSATPAGPPAPPTRQEIAARQWWRRL
ncbi:putative E3 ubiquitin-protein ligase UNKL isoform X2 [Pleurodeles waltl]|uniref:putative E3 ubiquitin-protein ligase UNKL isoform X2 n=1 Tax=Pleurodeles waltl TaxID=8319 RepID=UPI003709AFB3